MKWKKDDIRCEYRPFYVSKLFTFIFILYSLFFIRKLISFAVPLSTLFASSSASQFLLKSEITLSVWQNIVHTCFENIGYLIDFEE